MYCYTCDLTVFDKYTDKKSCVRFYFDLESVLGLTI